MNLDEDLERLADAAVTDWPAIAFSGRLDAAIRHLYRTHLAFPPSWTPDDRDEFIAEHADMDAQQMISRTKLRTKSTNSPPPQRYSSAP